MIVGARYVEPAICDAVGAAAGVQPVGAGLGPFKIIGKGRRDHRHPGLASKEGQGGDEQRSNYQLVLHVGYGRETTGLLAGPQLGRRFNRIYQQNKLVNGYVSTISELFVEQTPADTAIADQNMVAPDSSGDFAEDYGAAQDHVGAKGV